ncbi:membrane protein insertion efficiency factor YidD [bacterium]|nr:membrane protein insertion efficiency factor YidD [bacterium]
MLKIIVVKIIKFYQFFSKRFWKSSCRFHPSCSQYTIEAVWKYGAIKGIWRGLKRVGKCHPFNSGGIDLP